MQEISSACVRSEWADEFSLQVLAHRELAHTRTEQSVLKACARDALNPFIVKLHYSFHDEESESLFSLARSGLNMQASPTSIVQRCISLSTSTPAVISPHNSLDGVGSGGIERDSTSVK